MASFTSLLHQLSPEGDAAAAAAHPTHSNPHAIPTPVDMAALFRLVQDQMGTLSTTAPTEDNRNFLRELVEALELDIENPPETIQGVPQLYLDTLDRVPRKKLKADESCPICAEKYLDDQYCLVVELPCHHSHRFDLECVGPWLLSKGNCPLCRKDLTKKKEVVTVEDDEEDDMDGLYA